MLCEPFRLPTDACPDFCRRQDVVAKLAVEFDCAFVSFQKLFSEDLLKAEANPRYWFWDFFHPTPAAHYRMADFWMESVAAHQSRAHANTAPEPRAKIENDNYVWYARHCKQTKKLKDNVASDLDAHAQTINSIQQGVNRNASDIRSLDNAIRSLRFR